MPDLIIAAAERYGIMRTIDRWVVEKVLTIGAQNLIDDTAILSINLSGKSFCDPHFTKYLIKLIDKTTAPAERLCFEITETAMIVDLNADFQFIQKIKNYGFSFTLDDFGKGACSFTYLKELPVDYAKIDGGSYATWKTIQLIAP